MSWNLLHQVVRRHTVSGGLLCEQLVPEAAHADGGSPCDSFDNFRSNVVGEAAIEFDQADALLCQQSSCLTAATALLLRGLSVTVVDSQHSGANTSRAAVVHARTLETLEAMRVAERLVAKGLQVTRFTIRDRDRVLIPVHFDKLPTRYPYALMISQAVTESVLLQRLGETGGRVLRPRTVVDVKQDADSVTATLDDGASPQARYLIGADGMHSKIRERSGIAFRGNS